MLSYLHRFHAGGFADVHKHLVLARVLAALGRKAKPFCVLDVHGGEGVYDLTHEDATVTGEAEAGIFQLNAAVAPPDEALPYLQALDAVRKRYGKMAYPGSPAVSRAMLRDGDRLVAIELHPQAHKALRRNFRDDPQVHVHKRDAMEALAALTPPEEKRGVAVIDPAYEIKSEYVTVPAAVAKVYPKWRAGVFLIWYPLLPDGRHQDLLNAIAETDYPEVYVSEWLRSADASGRGMYGSGVAVINPPWKLDEEMEHIATWLTEAGFEGEHRPVMLTA